MANGQSRVYLLQFRTSHLMRCYNSYRFRLLSISCDPNFTFSIDGHKMTVIEVEGINVQPLVVDSIQIFVGTRGSTSVTLFVLLINRDAKQANVTRLL
jgi:FtsP/CotA-like multicopper oxidase with cupredoxin domain